MRGRPTLNLRGRGRGSTTARTTAATLDANEAANDSENSVDDKPTAARVAAPSKASRFNINRAAGSRLPPRNKFAKATTEQPTNAVGGSGDESSVDSSNDIKAESADEGAVAATGAEEGANASPNGLNRLKTRTRPGVGGASIAALKTDRIKGVPTAGAGTGSGVVPPRKVNPLLAKRRLQIGAITTGRFC